MSIKFNGHKILKQFSHRKWQIMLIFSLITSVAHFNFSIVCIRRVPEVYVYMTFIRFTRKIAFSHKSLKKVNKISTVYYTTTPFVSIK